MALGIEWKCNWILVRSYWDFNNKNILVTISVYRISVYDKNCIQQNERGDSKNVGIPGIPLKLLLHYD